MNTATDLLPESVVNRRYVASRLKGWAMAWLVVAIVTSYFCIVRRGHLRDIEVQAACFAAEASPLKELQNEQRKMMKEVKSIRERESWLIESDSQQTLQLLGIISHAAAKNDGRINVQTLALSTIERPVAGAEVPTGRNKRKAKEIETEQRMQLDLNGVAVDDLSVASFIAGLREANVFESVELKSSERQIFENHETRQYAVMCVY